MDSPLVKRKPIFTPRNLKEGACSSPSSEGRKIVLLVSLLFGSLYRILAVKWRLAVPSMRDKISRSKWNLVYLSCESQYQLYPSSNSSQIT